MIKSWKWKIIDCFLTVIQVALAVGVLLLERLAKVKMGVARHLVYKNYTLEGSWFTPSLMTAYRMVLMVSAIILSVLLIKNIKIYNKRQLKNQIATLIINIIVLGVFYILDKTSFKAYYYILMAAGLAIFIQYTKLLFIEKTYDFNKIS